MIANPLDTFLQLLRIYFVAAWPFFIVHLYVFIQVLRLRRDIVKEIDALRDWNDRRGDGVGSECVAALKQFVDQSERLGSHGVLVPMTDFSDRLDSYVNGQIESLHSRVNLFLIVGVAGTFFAMFGFAWNAVQNLGNPAKLSESLAFSLSQAFPVGFVGLALTFFGHFFAFALEKRFRRAVNLATQYAMAARSEAITGIHDRIENALRPLFGLQQTLEQTLTPVIEGFRTNLNQTSELLQQQIQPLREAIGGFGRAVANLEQPSSALLEAATIIPASLGQVNVLHKESLQQLQETSRVVESLSGTVKDSSDSLLSAAVELRQTPALIAGQLGEGIAQLTAVASDGCDKVVQKFDQGLSRMSLASTQAWTDIAGNLGSQFEQVRAPLSDAASRLQATCDHLAGVPNYTREQVEALVQGIGASTTETMQRLATDVNSTWNETGIRFVTETQRHIAASVDSMSESMRDTGQTVREAAQNLGHLSINAQAAVREAFLAGNQVVVQQLQPHVTQAVMGLQEYLPAAVENLHRAEDHSKALVDSAAQLPGHIGGVVGELNSAADRWSQLLQQIERTAGNVQSPPNENLLQAIRDLDGTVSKLAVEVQRLNRPFWSRWSRARGV
jgi:ABC-type transporter Mla subunit MlaD